jgi:hypothetical protein
MWFLVFLRLGFFEIFTIASKFKLKMSSFISHNSNKYCKSYESLKDFMQNWAVKEKQKIFLCSIDPYL